MDELRITFLGFGSANRALARMLLTKSVPPPVSATRIQVGGGGGRRRKLCLHGTTMRLVPWRIVGIITRRHGRVCVPLLPPDDDIQKNKQNYWEIDVEMALHRVESGGILDRSVIIQNHNHFSNHNHNEENNDEVHRQVIISDQLTNADETIHLISRLGQTKTSNIVVEAIPSNSKGNGEPAISFIAMALQSKMHVVSANKIPLAYSFNNNDSAHHGRGETYWKLQQLAQFNNVSYQHESAVMDGVPLFSMWKYTLPHATVTSIRGCLNSTTTMILSRMEGNNIEADVGNFDADTRRESFQDALIAAQDMGIVEEDESLDLDGYDAAVKLRALLVFLSSLTAFNNTIKPIVPTMDEIPRDSIRNVTPDYIRQAYSNNGTDNNKD